MPISEHAAKCLQDLRANYTNRQGISLSRLARGSIEVAFLRGYQAGYEDCIMGKKPKHYTRSKKEIKKDEQ